MDHIRIVWLLSGLFLSLTIAFSLRGEQRRIGKGRLSGVRRPLARQMR